MSDNEQGPVFRDPSKVREEEAKAHVAQRQSEKYARKAERAVLSQQSWAQRESLSTSVQRAVLLENEHQLRQLEDQERDRVRRAREEEREAIEGYERAKQLLLVRGAEDPGDTAQGTAQPTAQPTAQGTAHPTAHPTAQPDPPHPGLEARKRLFEGVAVVHKDERVKRKKKKGDEVRGLVDY